MAGEVERHGLEETRFLAKRGDLLIWDAWLLHGGSEIARAGASRKSVITHYFSKSDCDQIRAPLVPYHSGGYWMNRPPQHPRDSQPGADTSHASGSAVTDGAAQIAAIPEIRKPMPLRERLEALDPDHH
jgi:hypothetical protein